MYPGRVCCNCQLVHDTSRIVGAYTDYIRQVVIDKKVCKLVTNMYVLSFFNPKQQGVI